MIRPHVGAKVSALVDGQLSPAEADRLWSHVMGCRHCRLRVEHEGWVKTQLAGLATAWPQTPPLGLSGSDAQQWAADRAQAQRYTPATQDRRAVRTIAAIGAGSIGAAMVGVLALTATADPTPDRRAPVTTSLNQSTTAVPARVRTTP